VILRFWTSLGKFDEAFTLASECLKLPVKHPQGRAVVPGAGSRDRAQSPGIRGGFARRAAGAADPPFYPGGKDIFR
jgi:hypothetical protein